MGKKKKKWIACSNDFWLNQDQKELPAVFHLTQVFSSGFLQAHGNVVSLLGTPKWGACISSQINNICKTLWHAGKCYKCQIPEQTLKQGFFATPWLNKQRKSKLHLQFPSVHLKREKNQQIQPVIFKLEFPLRFCFLAFPSQCLFSLSVLNTFYSRSSTQLRQAWHCTTGTEQILFGNWSVQGREGQVQTSFIAGSVPTWSDSL